MFKKIALTIAATVLLAAYVWQSQRPPANRPDYPKTALTIIRADGARFPFTVEVALGETNQAYGLMFIHSMAADMGMIFPYNPPRPVAFWMKNTLIPLDMLFIDADHKIGHIATNARPGDVTPIPSEIPVSAVIELNAGTAKKDRLAVGDSIETTALSPQP